jgi:hypothetical protein
MKKTIFIVLGLFLTGGLGYYLYTASFDQEGNKPPINRNPPTENMTPTDSIEPRPTDTGQPEIPQDWTRVYDGALEFEIAYPNDWSVQPATNLQGESAVYSFDPQQTPDTGGVPSDQLKVGIVYFAPYGNREVNYEDSEIIFEQEVNVDGYSATQREIQGSGGGSVTTEVNLTNGGIYLISAYPPNSQMLDTYNQMLNYINLDKPSPVAITNPELGQQITSPVEIEGQAPGNWFFEANLPISLQTVSGETLTETGYTTSEDWMTEQMIDFSTELTFETPENNFGYVVIQTDNPSGIPSNTTSFYWPVAF